MVREAALGKHIKQMEKLIITKFIDKVCTTKDVRSLRSMRKKWGESLADYNQRNLDLVSKVGGCLEKDTIEWASQWKESTGC